MTAGRTAGPVTARHVTAALRGLFPDAALSSSAGPGGQVLVRMPGTSADELGVTQTGSASAAAWLSQKLGAPVQVSGARPYRRPGWGRFVEFTVTAGPEAAGEQDRGTAAGQRRTGPVQEVTATGGGSGPVSTGLLLRWTAATADSSADLVTAHSEIRGFLVTDGRDSGGARLFAAYLLRDGFPEQAVRGAGVPAGIAAILGPPAPPATRYATRVPVLRAAGRAIDPVTGAVSAIYEGPGGRTTAVLVRNAADGPALHTRSGAAAAARRQLGLTTAAGPGPQLEL